MDAVLGHSVRHKTRIKGNEVIYLRSAIFAVFLVSSSVHATVATIPFTGRVTTFDTDLNPDVSVGQLIDVVVSYDTNATEISPGQYQSADPFFLSLTAPSWSFVWTHNDSSFLVEDDVYIGASVFYDNVEITSSKTGGTDTIGGTPISRVIFVASTTAAVPSPWPDEKIDMISDNSMPDDFSKAEDLFFYVDNGTNGQDFVRIRMDVLPVPVPAAAWLFGSALGLLGWMRRKAA
jgi:hypothetical protein